eukprot:scaffold56491_cov75-Phaeocystis_antarctica.AAC.2
MPMWLTSPEASCLRQIASGPSCHTRRACCPSGSWLMARSSGAMRMRRVAALILRGSLPSISGAASAHQKAKCVRCSVCVRPPTVPHTSREM